MPDVIQKKLFAMQDIKYRDFQAGLIPGMDTDSMIGVRTPQLRALAKEMLKALREDGRKTVAAEANGKRQSHSGAAEDLQEISAATSEITNAKCVREFLSVLPHEYFDEMQLHAFIISGIRDYDECMEEVERFLPFVNNWATCDQLSPKAFAKHKPELLEHIKAWISSDRTYTVRFAIGMLMTHFLDADFRDEYLKMVSAVRSEEYYINMMIAWYFATALAKQWDAAIPYIEERRLSKWVHNKTIQKAIESYRITEEQKDYLRTLRIK